MKLIIEVDEKRFEEIKQIANAQFELKNKTEAQIIANGTPYNPSGDCISREALKETLRSYPQTDDMRTTELIGFFEKLIDNAQAIPQVTVFTESTDEKAVADLKAELENVIEARPQGDCISRSDLRKEVVGMMINKADDLEEVEFEINSALASVCEKIINAQAIPLPNEQIAWEQGYEVGLAQGKQERPQGEWVRKEDVIHHIAKQYSEHNELVPIWLSIGDMKGGAE